jgi:hypothetical protein
MTISVQVFSPIGGNRGDIVQLAIAPELSASRELKSRTLDSSSRVPRKVSPRRCDAISRFMDASLRDFARFLRFRDSFRIPPTTTTTR